MLSKLTLAEINHEVLYLFDDRVVEVKVSVAKDSGEQNELSPNSQDIEMLGKRHEIINHAHRHTIP